jgi:signal recognition particle receptor subunit beta
VRKTTAISSVSAVKMVKTEELTTATENCSRRPDHGRLRLRKVALEGGSVLRLYGAGTEALQFMWKIVAPNPRHRRARRQQSSDPMADVDMYLENFRQFADTGAVVVGVGRTETHPTPTLDDYYAHLGQRGLLLPVFNVDVRQGDDVLMLLDVLFGVLEMGGGA